MIVLLALFILAPPIALVFTVMVATALIGKRIFLALFLIAQAAAFTVIAVWEMRYDLGLDLPDVDWLPSGADSESALAGLSALMLMTLILARVWWPAQTRRRHLALVAALLWVLILMAFVALSGIDFSH